MGEARGSRPTLTRIAGIHTAGTGIVVLVAWAAGLFSRAAIGAPYVSMNPNTAACSALAEALARTVRGVLDRAGGHPA